MNWTNILNTEPVKEDWYVVKTNLGMKYFVSYSKDFEIFEHVDKDEEIGWKDNGENKELVTHYVLYSDILTNNSLFST